MATALQCDQCGQVDDHPKHHYAKPDGTVESHHFDCVPHTILQDLTHVTEHQMDPDQGRFRAMSRNRIPDDELDEHKSFVLRVREQAQGGLHGDELREWIVANGPTGSGAGPAADEPQEG